MNDIELEKKIIGSILVNPDLYIESSGLITPLTFFDSDHGAIYEAVESLFNKAVAVNIDSVQKEIKRNESRANCYDLVSYASGGRGFSEQCLILREHEISRNQTALGVELANRGGNDKVDPLETNEYLLNETERITSLTDMSRPVTNAELITEITKRMEAAGKTDGITGIKTGYPMLDIIYAGRQPTDLIIKAGRPAMGKTSQALCESKNMAFDLDYNVVFFSLEMGAEQLMQRLISIESSIPLNEIRTGQLSDAQWIKYNKHVEKLSGNNLMIVDDIYNLSGIRTRCKKLKMRGKLDVVFIDYLQLIVHHVGKGRSKENEVSEISRSLKMLAKDLKVPVIALSQLSRACESRQDKKPMLSDLRDSGAIEQDADVVEFVYRPEYYEELREPSIEGKAYVLIQKHRNGSLKDVEFNFVKECTRFDDPSFLPPPIEESYGRIDADIVGF